MTQLQAGQESGAEGRVEPHRGFQLNRAQCGFLAFLAALLTLYVILTLLFGNLGAGLWW